MPITHGTNASPFNSPYSEFIYKSRYSRWLDDEGRRENWDETVHRYLRFMNDHLEKNYKFTLMTGRDYDLYDELFDAIYNLEVMPSMRAIMTAGKALERDNVAGYNCSYLPVDNVHAFDEAMYILLCGTGVGFSVERQYVTLLPEVPSQLFGSETTIVVADSKAGWAKSLRQLVALLYSGEVPRWDVSKVRPAGARLKTFGGRASGPAPLVELFEFVIEKFKGAKGRKLNSLECHDIMCKIGEVVVVGGVRRSAMISLSNLSDDRMRNAKTGNWWEHNAQRALSNNSVSYTEKPDVGSFLEEWTSLYRSKSGERGIFSRVASKRQAGKNGRRDTGFEFGTNPCSEIILRPKQFCNLTEVVVRVGDGIEELSRKVRLASILGTFQSTLTDFPYLSKEWKKNTEEERLLGLSLTGILDNGILSGVDVKDAYKTAAFGVHEDSSLAEILEGLKNVAIETNHSYATQLGINPSAAITCVKPSGTVSQLVDSASGIHARHSQYYIRSVRADNKDPLTSFLKDSGVIWEPELLKPDQTTVFYFPMKSPDGAVTRNDMSAIEQLELWKVYQEHWCEHKPSITVSVGEGEWPSVGGWVYDNFDMVSGVSFLPRSDHTYKQAPYEECSEERYLDLQARTPVSINWELLMNYENTDQTAGAQTAACGPDGCEIVDLV